MEIMGLNQVTPSNWWIKIHHPVSYTDIIVTCFDMSVHEKSTVRLIYQVDGVIYRMAVEEDVVMPTQTTEHNGVMVCSTGYGPPP